MPDAILIVCGGLLQVPAVEAAHDLDLHVVMTDARLDAPAMALADEPIALDIYDAAGHADLVDDLRKRHGLRGVFTEGADAEVTVATAAERAGLPGIPVSSALNTKNKARMRACFDAHDIPNPTWAEVTDEADATAAGEQIGFPLMVKAVDNCASRGTTRVHDVDALHAAVSRAKEVSTTGTALLEACYVGPEQSVELLYDEDGRPHRLNIVDRPFADDDFAIELGHLNPTRLPAASQVELFELVEAAATAVGVNFGAFKADTIWTAEGPRILEVTARLSGGFDCQKTTPLASGRNFIKAAMRLACGMPSDPDDLTAAWHRHAAAWTAFPTPGRVTRIGGVEAAMAVDGVDEVLLRVGVGDVIPPYHDNGARPAFVISVGDTADEAVGSAMAGVAALNIETAPL